jgi:hypothetical protein
MEFAAGSKGNVAPIATIAGENTSIDNADGVTIDKTGRIYVSNSGGNSILIFAAGSNGNVAPGTIISGANTQLKSPAWVTLDSAQNLYVANSIPTVFCSSPPAAAATPLPNGRSRAPARI